MKWIPVDSSAICSVAYDACHHRLGIEFREKHAVYFYDDVPLSELEASLAAESKGRYLTTVFLPKDYRCTGPYRRKSAAQAGH